MAKQISKQPISLRLPEDTKQKLEKLAEVTGHSQSHLAIEAIKEFCDLQEWQLAAIQEGIEAADQGKLVDHEKVKADWQLRLKKANQGAG